MNEVVVWTDSGHDLDESVHGPWLQQKELAWVTTLHPVFQHRNRMTFETSPHRSRHDSTQQTKTSKLPQSISHLPSNYDRYLNAEIMACDAFYAVNEIFRFAAASEGQFLDLIAEKVRVASIGQPTPSIGLSELQTAKSLLEEHQQSIRENLKTVHDRGGPRWPCTTNKKWMRKTERAANQLELQYEHLLNFCNRLSEQCTSGMAVLASAQSHQQSEKAIDQSEKIMKLTVLAFFYVPLSFTTSFFGMNLKELNTDLSIWTWFCLSIPLIFVSFLLCFWDNWKKIITLGLL